MAENPPATEPPAAPDRRWSFPFGGVPLATLAMSQAGSPLRYSVRIFGSLLQTFIWQEYDLAPQFPTLRKFLDFWSHNLDGKLHSVKVSSVDLLTPPKWRNAQELLTLH